MAGIHMRRVRTDMDTSPVRQDALLPQARLLQLVSPALPTGGFSYSQGLEWAVEAGWVRDVDALEDWLVGLIEDGLVHLDLPILARLHQACQVNDLAGLSRWGALLLAGRESHELRHEEHNRARAMLSLLCNLGVAVDARWRAPLVQCQAAPFALAMTHWQIARRDGLLGYAWSWLENQVAAAIKLVPLGQTDGQRVQLKLAGRLPAVVEQALSIGDDEIGASSSALAIASARHETQYTRLFRS